MLVWNPEGADDRVWAMLREHLTDSEIVELGSFIAVTYGQQRVIKTWGVGHGELPAHPGAGLAPARSES
jgi:alkylhydroperoxidase family enzyme